MNKSDLRTIATLKRRPVLPRFFVVVALGVLTAFSVKADITFDAASSATAGANATSVVWAHTVSPDPLGSGMLVVSVAIETTTTDRPVTSVTYGSQSLTLVPGSRSANGAATINAGEQWYLPAPTPGTANITVSFGGPVVNGTVAGAVSLFGVSQSAPEAVAATANAGTDGLYSLSITTLTAGAWLVDVVGNGTGGATGYTPGGSQTERWDLVANTQIRAAGSTREVLTPGAVTNTWTCVGGVSRETHSISAFAPAPPAPVAVTISSPTNGAVVSTTSFAINATATVNPGTVTNVDFYVDAALVGSDTSFPFSIVAAGVSAGAHSLTAVAWDGNGNSVTSSVVNVTAANLAPTVALTSPANGSAVLVGANVSLAATAVDDGAVTNVDFYVDGALVASDDSSPFTGTYAGATLGAHALLAVAQDNGGLSTTSAVVNITAYTSFSAYEPFNYASLPTGTASTGTGFTGNWTCGATPAIGAGLTYSGLPTANSAMSSGSSRQFVSFLAPLSGGTEYVSFLYRASGNMGGNICGVYFPNGGTGLFFGFGLAPFSGSQGGFGLGSMNTVGSGALGAANLASSFLGTYGTTYLVVLKIDFNTSGANDTVTVYINPTANAATPGVAATYTVSTFDVGTITGVGLNVQGGATITVDEIRRGATYGDVVGYNPPATPTGLVATPGVNTVGLVWDNASGATGYNILRGTSSGNYTVTNTSAANAYNDNSAVGGTTYYYVVQATNTSGVSAYSSEVSATPTIALPNVPTGLVATGTNGAVSLSWSVAAGAASYNVKRSTTSNAEVTISNVVANSYYDTDVVNGTTYYYKVSSTNSAGESVDSSEVSATPDLPPAAPTGLAATAGTNQVSLTWNASAGATSYNVKRATTSGAEVTIASAGSASYTDTTAVKFTQYFYTVSAVNANGESADSSEVTATPTGVYAPSAYEPFDYSAGPLANSTPSTAAGFTGNWNVSGTPNISAGLTYSNLPTANNSYVHGAAGAQTTVDFASPLSSGTKFVSFLFKGPNGDPGANACGMFLKGNNASSLFVGFRSPFSPTLTGFGLGTVNSTVLGGASGLGGTTAIDNSTTHFVVVQIDFNTSGANDTVSLWIDPPAGVVTPGGAANVVETSFDVGAISAFGVNVTGAFPIGLDEIRVGDTFGDVSGYVISSVNTTPTNIVSSVSGNQLTLSWPADRTGWKLQTQTNDLATGISGTWYDVAGSTATNEMTFPIDPANPTVFYRMTYP